MHHLPEHINQDIKKEIQQRKGLNSNKTEYQSRRNPKGKFRWGQKQPKHQPPPPHPPFHQ